MGQRTRLRKLMVKSRLPSMCTLREYAEAGCLMSSGCLMSYGVDFTDVYRRAAGFVDKILKGARPADLPIEQPTKFEFLVNRKTARAPGLTITPDVLGRPVSDRARRPIRRARPDSRGLFDYMQMPEVPFHWRPAPSHALFDV